MPALQIQSEIDFNDVLESASRLNIVDLEQLANRLNRLLAQKKAPSLPEREAELLLHINQLLPPAVRNRYRQLNDKVHEGTITEAEHQEFLMLVDQVELADAERLKILIELAELRNISLDVLMSQLGIDQPTYA